MKLKHLFALALVVIGALFLWHLYASHGGVSGFKSGLGIG